MTTNLAHPEPRVELLRQQADAVTRREKVHHVEPEVVTRPFVLRAGVTQTDNQLHRFLRRSTGH